ncbi:hypothetical protein SAMN02910339_00359 [Lachnospiraceae bacterium YSD2013]|nr:hypothetical protein SAMN02910339_00359 [Lachnospiraceae bacterium YSD2013]
MKKKLLSILAMVTVVIAVTSCGTASDGPRTATSGNKTVSDLIEERIAEENAATTGSVASEEPAASEAPEAKETPEANVETLDESTEVTDVDLDLTVLSKTMVYSEVYNIMVSPEDYIGKSIRMNGIYNTFIDDSTGIRYFYCIIQDATACCAQGIEFELTDDYSFPADYPESGDTVTVVGNFDTYMEGEYMYCTLRDAVLEKSN